MIDALPPLLGAIAGAIFGSFLGNLVARWPTGRSVMAGRSCCESCGHVLGVSELVPLFSFALQRGRCRKCGSGIDPVHFWIELAAAAIGATALWVSPDIIGVAGMVFGLFLLALAALDARHFWLPDRLTLPMAGGGLLLSAMGYGPAFTDSVVGAVAGYAVLALLALGYRVLRGHEGMGGGDPKMLAGIGAWLGWQALPFVLLGASVVGLIFALNIIYRSQSALKNQHIAFGSMMAIAAWPLWVLIAGGVFPLAYI